jgi:motility quorum-sensing regulator / GCU-specific mRNA interferase toxin
MEHLNRPHYNLDELKALVSNPKTRVITNVARKNAFAALGLVTDDEIVEVILAIKRSDIYKTMTTHHSTKSWQDVYKPEINGKILYIKLQKNFDSKGVVIQLKDSDDN